MSTNVFADIGLPNPDPHLAKAGIVQTLSRIITEKGLTQAEAGARLGLSQPKVSALLHGQFRGYSIERLLRFVNALQRPHCDRGGGSGRGRNAGGGIEEPGSGLAAWEAATPPSGLWTWGLFRSGGRFMLFRLSASFWGRAAAQVSQG